MEIVEGFTAESAEIQRNEATLVSWLERNGTLFCVGSCKVINPDGGDFATGSLCWPVLNWTANHRRGAPEEFDISECPHLKPYSIACIAALGYVAGIGNVRLVPSKDSACNDHLARMGLFDLFDGVEGAEAVLRSTNVPIENLRTMPGTFSSRAMDVWESQLGGFAAGLKRKLADNLDEVIWNAIQHSESPIGCVVAGQAFPKTARVEVAVVDLGQTIRGHLSRKSEYSQLRDDGQAIVLATVEGVTGTMGTDNSGAGLAELREFFESVGGQLAILSGSKYVVFASGQDPQVHDFKGNFSGTLVNLQFDTNCGLPPPERYGIF